MLSSLRSAADRAKYPLGGLAFLAVIALLVYVAVGLYAKTFRDVVPVTLRAERAGSQLNQYAPVKLRGVRVGEVTQVTSEGRGAVFDLALEPGKVERVPADVKARIVPKTLFGERFVKLVVPDNPSSRHIQAGAVIPMDRSEVAVELRTIFDRLLPVLRAIDPAKLNATLNAIATALRGRGEELGENLVRLQQYLSELNPTLPTLERDIRLLADFADTYADAAPELLRVLDNLTVTAGTVTEKRNTLDAFLREVTTFAETGREVLAVNDERIIRLGELAVPTTSLLAQYAPEYPCLLAGLAKLEPRLGEAFGGGQRGLHITLEFIRTPEPYQYPEDLPVRGSARQRVGQYAKMSGYDVELGPHCYGLPNPPVPFPTPEEFDAGAFSAGGGPAGGGDGPRARPVSGVLTDASMGYAGTAAEQRVVNHIVGPLMGRPPGEVPDIATLLFGPMARGTVVSVE